RQGPGRRLLRARRHQPGAGTEDDAASGGGRAVVRRGTGRAGRRVAGPLRRGRQRGRGRTGPRGVAGDGGGAASSIVIHRCAGTGEGPAPAHPPPTTTG